MFQKMYGSVLKIISHTHKYPAGSGMERVGVSKSLLGTYDPTLGFTSDFASDDDAKCKILVVFSFFCFFLPSAASKFSQNAVTSTDASLRADVPISTARVCFYSLTCLALQLGHLSATQVKQVIMLSKCESPLPTADTQKVSVLTENLRDFGIWAFICFQQLSMVPVWTLKALFRNLSVRWNSPALAKIK